MEIKVIGAGCAQCGQLYKNTREAVTRLGIDADIQKVDDLKEIVKLGVMTAPSLMVDGKLLVSGRVAPMKTIENLLNSP